MGQSVAELRGLAVAGEFFFQGPGVIVTNEDAAAILIEDRGDAEAAGQGAAAGAGRRRWHTPTHP